MSNTPKLDKDDIELFRNAIGPVRPIQQNKVVHSSNKPKPMPLQTRADERIVLFEMDSGAIDPGTIETGDELHYKRPGIQNKYFQKLRRGQISIEAELDLHGMTVAEAKNALSQFLTYIKTRNKRCVRIIHGKGHGSRHGKPVLKNKLNHWLQQRDEVLAFCSARPIDGGTGAIYVLIKRLT